MKCDAVVLL